MRAAAAGLVLGSFILAVLLAGLLVLREAGPGWTPLRGVISIYTPLVTEILLFLGAYGRAENPERSFPLRIPGYGKIFVLVLLGLYCLAPPVVLLTARATTLAALVAELIATTEALQFVPVTALPLVFGRPDEAAG